MLQCVKVVENQVVAHIFSCYIDFRSKNGIYNNALFENLDTDGLLIPVKGRDWFLTCNFFRKSSTSTVSCRFVYETSRSCVFRSRSFSIKLYTSYLTFKLFDFTLHY